MNEVERGDEIWAKISTHRVYLYKIASRLSSNQDTAQDIVQDTLLSAFDKFYQFEGRSSLRTWLISILKNKLRDSWRQDKRWVSSPLPGEDRDDDFDDLFAPDVHWDEVDDRFVHWRNPEQALLDKQFIQILDFCINKLPKRASQAFMLSQVLEMSGKEVQEEMGISSSNYWVLIYRARMSLKLCLDKNWFEGSH